MLHKGDLISFNNVICRVDYVSEYNKAYSCTVVSYQTNIFNNRIPIHYMLDDADIKNICKRENK